MNHQNKEALAWDQPFFCRKWLHNRTNGDRISPNNTQGKNTAMNEELKHAGDIAKDPASFSIITYALMMVIATWGAIVRVIKEVMIKEKSWQHITCIFISEICISGFVGTITFSLCLSMSLTLPHCAALTGIASYMGGRSLSFLEAFYKAWKVRP